MGRHDPAAQRTLAVTEEPLPLQGWEPGSGTESYGLLADDLRSLMRRLAEAEFARDAAAESRRQAQERHLLALLEVVDAFERVFRSIQARQDQVTPQMQKWIGNFRTVLRMLRGLLAAEGVVRIENLDQGFDPAWHRAMETVADPGRPDGTVVEELRAGYMWHDRVLRKSEVVVVRNQAAE